MRVESESGEANSSHDAERELRTLKLSVALYLIVFVLKLGAYYVTGVMALLAEGLHTLSDIFVSGFLLIALWWSRKKPDEVHRFGYGRAQYVGALVAAVLFISFTSFELYKESIPRLFTSEVSTHQNLPVAMGVLGLSMLLAAAPIVALLRQKTRGAAAKAQLMELVNDQLGLAAALVGTIFLALGFPIADPIASIVVATIIGVNGVALFRENLSYLIGRSPDDAFLAKTTEAARAVQGVRSVHGVRAQVIGPEAVHVDLHVEVDPSLSVEDADRLAHQVADAIHALTPNQDVVNVHVDPLGSAVAGGC